MSRESPPRCPPEGTSTQDCSWDLPPKSRLLETTTSLVAGGWGPRHAHAADSHAEIFFYKRTNYRNQTTRTNLKNTALKERKADFQKHTPRNSVSVSARTGRRNRGRRASASVCLAGQAGCLRARQALRSGGDGPRLTGPRPPVWNACWSSSSCTLRPVHRTVSTRNKNT